MCEISVNFKTHGMLKHDFIALCTYRELFSA